MPNLPVREMVLYKHGVGFFIRAGALTGNSLTLTFRQDEINDILKSLTVIDNASGEVRGIHYQTPMDYQTRMANTSMQLGEDQALGDLINALRGTLVDIQAVGESGTVERVRGRLIGMDNHAEIMRETKGTARILVQGETDAVHVLYTADLRSIHPLNEVSLHDLAYFLDTQQHEDSRRVVHVALSEGAHDLVVRYVAPSPVWRVSYRFVGETTPNSEGGKALLQGWGLFDNRFEEDLEDVQVTLVAGQPISFVYDLYSSEIPERPTIRDEARVAPQPVEFLANEMTAFNEPYQDDDDLVEARLSPPMAASFFSGGGKAKRQFEAIDMASAAKAAPAAATGKDAGEFFQYVVNVPVSVKRGESALVPILGTTLRFERELLYNGEKAARHPVASLRFKNTSGLTLERGPITVIVDGDYQGEAVVSFAKADGEVYLPYAVELGISITERSTPDMVTEGVILEGLLIIFQQYQTERVIYVIENTTPKARTITVEAPIRAGWELFETPVPTVTTAQERRWQVRVPAGGATEFTRKERFLRQHSVAIRNLEAANLKQIIEKQWLNEATSGELGRLIALKGEIEAAQKEIQKRMKTRDERYKQQEQFRANLEVLKAEGDEASLRGRILKGLEGAQDKLDALETEIEALNGQIAAAEEGISAILKGFGG
ncbi:MAG TPA: hypothetical protein PLD47_09790 [Aggregatilineales bacterium]|nr:hypothetical protein [Anaerolineales bacterium]HRE48004.1 hypothetical protein [Aggregatilineales bacterium]